LAIVWVREQQKKKAKCNFATTFMLILSLLRYDFAHFLFLASRTAYTRFFDGTDYTFTEKKLDVIVFRSSSTYTRKVFIFLFDYFPYKQKRGKNTFLIIREEQVSLIFLLFIASLIKEEKRICTRNSRLNCHN
jgi:hypothetical protein